MTVSMAGKMQKRISQETFDEAVADNIETFEMDPEEAVREAITEFEMQGVNLDGIIKDYCGPDGRGEHPVIKVVKALEAALGAEEEGAEAAVVAQLAALDAALGPEGTAGACAEAGKNGAVETVLGACRPSGFQAAALATLQALLGHEQNREFFFSREGPKLMHDILTEQSADAVVVMGAVGAGAAGATKHEGSKAAFMKLEAEHAIVAALHAHANAPGTVKAICALLGALSTADDPREPAGGAFRNAQVLAKAGAADALLHSLSTATAGGALGDQDRELLALVVSLCNTLKKVAANEEVCKGVAESGGVGLIVGLLQGTGAGQPSVARAACALLRQLAGSDTIKPLIIDAAGLPVCVKLLAFHSGGQAKTEQGPAVAAVEQTLGLLVALCLRNPAGVTAAAEAGCLEAATQVMAAMPKASAVQRQACMFLRNAVVRNPEYKAPILGHGAEALLRSAKRNHPRDCVDVGSAALRDLGCDNYNEGWAPSTVIMGADGVMRTPEELDAEAELEAQATGVLPTSAPICAS